MANGKTPLIRSGTVAFAKFLEALTEVCKNLAIKIVKDGEGATKLITVRVQEARSSRDAKKVATSVAKSSLVKTACFGEDPNWGRIMVALGKSGVGFEESKVDLYINDIHIVHNGTSFPYLKDAVISAMNVPEIRFRIDLNCGDSSGTAWGCDLTEDYVTLNSAYST